jgi:flagellar motor switch/type III secretory pathway protein FliN
MTGTELATHNADHGRSVEKGLATLTQSVPWMRRIEDHSSWEVLAKLQVTMLVEVVLSRFTVSDLLALKDGQVFESLSPAVGDVSLMVGEVQLGWCEFEVLDKRMAVRLTRLG